MTTTAVSPKTFICCPPPPGTPDPTQPPDFETLKPRSRLFLPAQEQHTCVFAAADRLRLIMGEHPSVSEHPLRLRELIVAKTRSRYIELDTEIYWKQDVAKQMMNALKQKIDKEIARQFLEKNESNSNVAHPEIFIPLRAFVEQNRFTDLYEFVMHEYHTRMTELVKRFFKEIIEDPGETQIQEFDRYIDDIVQDLLSEGHSFEAASCYLKAISNKIILKEAFGLKQSTWHPSQLFSSLIQELDENGPLQVLGHFGIESYEETPFQLSDKVKATVSGETQERSLWGWKPNAQRKQQKADHHSIVIVGARNETVEAKKIEHIYFIDPLDPSDPKNPELQKIYVMSLKRLREGIFNLDAMQFRNATTGENVFSDPAEEGKPNNYALHGDPKVNYL